MALTQVSTSGIKDGSVSTADLADGSISTSKVADDAITADKLNNTGVTAGSYTLSSVTVDAQGRVTAASSGTPVDADKIIEGNTEVEAVDTGSDGHIKATTEGSERLRVGPAGQVGIGGANYGTSGQVLMSGGASAAPTWGDVSSSPTFEATASGTLSNGQTVIVQSDGTVKAIGLTELAGANIGNEVTIEALSAIDNIAGVYNPDTNQVLVAYCDQSSNGYCELGTITASTISFINKINFTSSVDDEDGIDLVYDTTNDYYVICYSRTSDSYLRARTVRIEGGQHIYFGSERDLYVGSVTRQMKATYHEPSDTTYIVHTDGSYYLKYSAVQTDPSNHQLDARVTNSTISSQSSSHATVISDPDQDAVAFFWYEHSNNRARAIVGTPNTDKSLTFGSVNTYMSGGSSGDNNAGFIKAAYDENVDKVVICYGLGSDNFNPYVRVGTVTGGTTRTIVLGSHVRANNASTDSIGLIYDSFAKRCIAAIEDSGIKTFEINISGTTPSFSSVATVENSSSCKHVTLVGVPNVERTLYLYERSTDVQARLRRPTSDVTNLTTSNYIGISDGAYANGATATIQVVGSIDDAQSSLTPGLAYYVKGDGTLSTTADTPSVLAGIAVSATELLIK